MKKIRKFIKKYKKSIIQYTIIIVIFLVLYNVKLGNVGSRECPEKVEGKPEAALVIKYFKSPFCSICWTQDPILTKLKEERGDDFRFETYDVRYCTDEVRKYGAYGTPSFAFEYEDKVFVERGYQPRELFDYAICELTGKCV